MSQLCLPLAVESQVNEGVRFTPREYEVFNLLASGNTVDTIAGELQIEPATVWRYLSTIYKKMGVTNLQQAYHKAQIVGIANLALSS